MNVVPIPTTLISGPYRFRGWRGTIRQGGLTVWRCVCDRPHRTKDAADACSISELRARLGRQGMRIWTATYRPKQQFTQAEIDRMDEARELVLLEAKISLPTSQADLASIPEKIKAATAEVVRLEAAILDAKTSDDIRHNQRTIELIKVVVQEHREARQRCESAFLTGEWVIGGWLRAEEDYEATGTRGIIQPGMDGAGGNSELPPADQPATLKEKVGSKMYAWRLKQLADLSLDIMRSYAARLHAAYKEATLTGIVDLKRAAETKARREASIRGEPLPSGMEYRVGDCRVALDDIEDETVAAIITDPPYGRDAEPLYVWLAEFAERVLVPGGSLICYTGTGMLPRDYQIFGAREGLTYWWTPILLHGDAHKMFRAGVRANHKPILWYVKGNNRRTVHGDRTTIVPDVLNDRGDRDEGRNVSAKDKTDHQWAQGNAGVAVWIHHLTQRELKDGDGAVIQEAELIVDPFAGSGTWGRIAAEMGRRWIGCDVEDGGNESAVVDDLDDAAD